VCPESLRAAIGFFGTQLSVLPVFAEHPRLPAVPQANVQNLPKPLLRFLGEDRRAISLRFQVGRDGPARF
jgi:hypothetical protein